MATTKELREISRVLTQHGKEVRDIAEEHGSDPVC